MAAPSRDGQGHRPLGCSPAVPGAVPSAPRASSLDAQPRSLQACSGWLQVPWLPARSARHGDDPRLVEATRTAVTPLHREPLRQGLQTGWAPGPGDGGPADTACAPASGEGPGSGFTRTKALLDTLFFIQRKNKNYDVYRSLSF
ncbi:hypothetical protein CapIbe_021081 [Capra ibex]